MARPESKRYLIHLIHYYHTKVKNLTFYSTFIKSTDLVDVFYFWNSDVYSGDVHLLHLVFHDIHILLSLLPFLFNLSKNIYILNNSLKNQPLSAPSSWTFFYFHSCSNQINLCLNKNYDIKVLQCLQFFVRKFKPF